MITTKDIAFASYLLALGHRQAGVTHDPEGVCYWTVDVDGEDPDELWGAYIRGGRVAATTFVGIWRRLKREALRARRH